MSWARIRSAVRTTAAVTGATVLLFLLLEGAAGAAFSAYILLFRGGGDMQAEQAHAEYDPELGWINRANIQLPDLYGPGIGFRSNGQRFRADRDYPAEPPAGTTRVVCSGDSFTMGHSVADSQAWCARLEGSIPGIETVNMGMAAYGVDQAFLWYRRDAAALRHQLHLFAFITADFERMAYDNFLGYPKPWLRLADGRLEVANQPVPETFRSLPRLQRTREAVLRLDLVQAGLSVLRRLGVGPSEADGRVLDDAQVAEVARAVFAELAALNAARGSQLVLVYLPRSGDRNGTESAPWRALVRQEADRLGVRFIDLVEAFQELPLDDGERLFMEPYRPSHYNSAGNAWVAEQLAARLLPAGVPGR